MLMIELNIVDRNIFSKPKAKAQITAITPITKKELALFLRDVNRYAEEINVPIRRDFDTLASEIHRRATEFEMNIYKFMSDVWFNKNEIQISKADRSLLCQRIIKYMSGSFDNFKMLLKFEQTLLPHLYEYSIDSFFNELKFELVIDHLFTRDSFVIRPLQFVFYAHTENIITRPKTLKNEFYGIFESEESFYRSIFTDILNQHLTPIRLFLTVLTNVKKALSNNEYQGLCEKGYSESLCETWLYRYINPILSNKNKIEFSDFVTREESNCIDDNDITLNLLSAKSRPETKGKIIDINFSKVILKIFRTLAERYLKLDKRLEKTLDYFLDENQDYSPNVDISSLRHYPSLGDNVFRSYADIKEIESFYDLIQGSEKRLSYLLGLKGCEGTITNNLHNLLTLKFATEKYRHDILKQLKRHSSFELGTVCKGDPYALIAIMRYQEQLGDLDPKALGEGFFKTDDFLTTLNLFYNCYSYYSLEFSKPFALELLNNLGQSLANNFIANFDDSINKLRVNEYIPTVGFRLLFREPSLLNAEQLFELLQSKSDAANVLVALVFHCRRHIPDLMLLLVKLLPTDKRYALFNAPQGASCNTINALIAATKNNYPETTLSILGLIKSLPLELQQNIIVTASDEGETAFSYVARNCPSSVFYPFLDTIKSFESETIEKLLLTTSAKENPCLISALLAKYPNKTHDILFLVKSCTLATQLFLCKQSLELLGLLLDSYNEQQARELLINWISEIPQELLADQLVLVYQKVKQSEEIKNFIQQQYLHSKSAFKEQLFLSNAKNCYYAAFKKHIRDNEQLSKYINHLIIMPEQLRNRVLCDKNEDNSTVMLAILSGSHRIDSEIFIKTLVKIPTKEKEALLLNKDFLNHLCLKLKTNTKVDEYFALLESTNNDIIEKALLAHNELLLTQMLRAKDSTTIGKLCQYLNVVNPERLKSILRPIFFDKITTLYPEHLSKLALVFFRLPPEMLVNLANGKLHNLQLLLQCNDDKTLEKIALINSFIVEQRPINIYQEAIMKLKILAFPVVARNQELSRDLQSSLSTLVNERLNPQETLNILVKRNFNSDELDQLMQLIFMFPDEKRSEFFDESSKGVSILSFVAMVHPEYIKPVLESYIKLSSPPTECLQAIVERSSSNYSQSQSTLQLIIANSDLETTLTFLSLLKRLSPKDELALLTFQDPLDKSTLSYAIERQPFLIQHIEKRIEELKDILAKNTTENTSQPSLKIA